MPRASCMGVASTTARPLAAMLRNAGASSAPFFGKLSPARSSLSPDRRVPSSSQSASRTPVGSPKPNCAHSPSKSARLRVSPSQAK
jgi:hypothetical protein